jgi:hypothetical protein
VTAEAPTPEEPGGPDREQKGWLSADESEATAPAAEPEAPTVSDQPAPITASAPQAPDAPVEPEEPVAPAEPEGPTAPPPAPITPPAPVVPVPVAPSTPRTGTFAPEPSADGAGPSLPASPVEKAVALVNERPEVGIAWAFAGGMLLATILRRLAR